MNHSQTLDSITTRIPFHDLKAATSRLEGLLSDENTARLLEDGGASLLGGLSQAPSPDRALLGLDRLLSDKGERPRLASILSSSPELLRALLHILGSSPFLAELMISDRSMLAVLQNLRMLRAPKDASRLVAEAQERLHGVRTDHYLKTLTSWQQAELLRIGSADLLGLADLPTVTRQLSDLADTTIAIALEQASIQTHTDPADFVVIALGKLGGAELNYSSDIDLLFLARRDPQRYASLAQSLIAALSERTRNGALYRVDMRLRPWGRSGLLVVGIDGYHDYLQEHARLWERQALLKARPVAGAVAMGWDLLAKVEPLLFDVQPEGVREDVREAKERIEGVLRLRGRDWGEVKSGAGSIRDIEFVTQYLQLVHGVTHPSVRSHNTLAALGRLHRVGALSSDDLRVLREGYLFLRPVEHYLQLVQGRQTHTLPDDPRELAYLGRRLGFAGEEVAEQLLARYEQHAAAIRSVFIRYLDPASLPEATKASTSATDVASRHLDRMGDSYADVFDRAEIEHHAQLAQQLGSENLVEVATERLGDDLWRVTVVAFDYPGELAIICGLLTAYGCDIREGYVFTYEPSQGHTTLSERRKIVDVFTVRAPDAHRSKEFWSRYQTDLAKMLTRQERHQPRAAQGALARMVARTVRSEGTPADLPPVGITVDSVSSERYTVVRVDAPDTPGFLYEFANALALLGYYIGRMYVTSQGSRVQDTLYLSDQNGRKVTDPERLQELSAATVLVKHFTHLLPNAPDPERALNHFQDFCTQLFSRDDWPAELASLTRPRVLANLARLLGVSDFLWTDFLRLQHENLLPIIRDVESLQEPRSAVALRNALQSELAAQAGDDAAQVRALNAFKDREIFRVDMRHIQGYLANFAAFSEELSDVAEAVIDAAYRMCEQTVWRRLDLAAQERNLSGEMAVLALGKLGGREIGYASDIELMFVYDDAASSESMAPSAAAERFEQIVRCFLSTIKARREGIFEIDLRLRPYGDSGSLAVPLTSFRRYFGPGGSAWPYERQALVRARYVCGDRALADRVLLLRDEYVYGPQAIDLSAMRAMRERQLRHMVTPGTINAKFSRGGLVDAEYLVQMLQMLHGARNAPVRCTNTQAGIAALHEIGVLSSDDYSDLRRAHLFLRRLIDALRMVRGNARDLTVPQPDSDEFRFLARRCSYETDPEQLRTDLVSNMEAIQALVDRLL